MSPRAACRLADLGFSDVAESAGKSDWLAFDLLFEGNAQLAGRAARRDVTVARMDESVEVAQQRLAQVGFGPAVVVSHGGVGLGAARHADLAAAAPAAPVASMLRFGFSTLRLAKKSIRRFTAGSTTTSPGCPSRARTAPRSDCSSRTT